MNIADFSLVLRALSLGLCGVIAVMVVACFQTSPSKQEIVSLHQDPQPTDTNRDSAQSSGDWIDLFDGQSLVGWKPIQFGGHDEFRLEEGRMVVEMGYPLAGVVYQGDRLPQGSYRLELDAMKIQGNDFFCCFTFPVDDEFCSLVLGGWGGTVSGISCVDRQDASDNETTTVRKYEYDQWYHVAIEVTPDRIECWVDNEQIVNLDRQGHSMSVRTEVLPSRPLGICSFSTTAAWRNIRYRPLTSGSQRRPPDDPVTAN